MPQCCSEAWSCGCFRSNFGPISAGSYGIFNRLVTMNKTCSIYMIQRLKNNTRNGGKCFAASKEV
jgi:hypothetical protein